MPNRTQTVVLEPFGARLRRAMDEYGPLCVGIDPHPNLLRQWGLPDDAGGLLDFSLRVLQATAGHVAAVKPQSALFERLGSDGVGALAQVVQVARGMGTLCIVDAKRGDIGSTMEGYAQAYLSSGSDLAGDAVTLSPFLGFGSLQPAIDTARENGRGVFVLCLTSNPQGVSVQHARMSSGLTVAAEIAQNAAQANARELGQVVEGCQAGALGSVGLVVGATIGQGAAQAGTDLLAVNGPLLAPGVGAQGGGAAELKAVFGSARRNVLASSSREILQAGPDLHALRQAALKTRETVSAALSG